MNGKPESQLSQLKKMTTIVVDTGDFETIKDLHPTDATTNPSLIYAAVQKSDYHPLVKEAIAYSKQNGHSKKEREHLLMEKLFVNFGIEILKLIPGRVSTEVDARLSFDVKGSIEKAKRYIALYEKAGISRERILVKLASTWEGTRAARQLEKEGIHCNMTLLFSIYQAVECAKAGATLISPFVGRILDWFVKAKGVGGFPPREDPGVQSVSSIYEYFKKYGYKTQIMGASFRNKEEIIELAGCDLLTIAPKFLEALQKDTTPITRKLDPQAAKNKRIPRISMTEKSFRYYLNDDAMATEKLAEGIRKFAADTIDLEKYIQQNFSQ